MKHYLKENGYEYTNIRERRWVCCKRETVRDAKQAYRQRERRALDRMVEQQVVEELSQSAEELRFLWGKYEEWREFADAESCSFSAETWR